ncbi:MAG: transporter, partial [Gammaproteobacteria bacterium]|nr:transporter [Gammaproteobacteria bacterium]
KNVNCPTRFLALVAFAIAVPLISGPVIAQDDGARTYWKGRAGTNVMSVQYLNMNLQASDALQFDPSHFIYPAADAEANIFVLSWARHMTLFNRPSVLSANLIGGSVDVEFDTTITPPEFLPPGVVPGASFSQSASGYADPSVQLDVNLFGTPPINAIFDYLNYEPTWTLDAAFMLGVPLGQYDDDRIANLGLNRFYGRVAFPFKYHFRVFSPGYRSSLEVVPSIWLFTENDDFLGQKLKNDPMWQIEAHWTHDFTRHFFGSLDLLYRNGFQSEIDGIKLGSDIEIGTLGFTLNFQVNDNVTIRTSFSSNVFGDSDIDTSMIRLQFVYAWDRAIENIKKLGSE